MTTQNPNDEFQVRLSRLARIKSMGIPTYPASFDKSHSVGKIVSESEGREFRSAEEVVVSATKTVSIAGRIVLFRSF